MSEDFLAPAEATVGAVPAPASGKKGLVIALVLVSAAAVGLALFSAYLWSVHSQWVAQNEQLLVVADDLGTDVAASRAHAEELQAQVDDTLTQLEEAKATVNDLANSEAQAGDDRQALIDVADGLQECADARQNLIDHLNEAYKWTPESLRANETSINAYCAKVAKAYREVVDG